MRLDARNFAIVAVASSHLTAMAQRLLGLSLGPKLITVAEVWQNRSSGPIVQIEASEAYQACLARFAKRNPPERCVSIVSELLIATTEQLLIRLAFIGIPSSKLILRVSRSLRRRPTFTSTAAFRFPSSPFLPRSMTVLPSQPSKTL